MGVDQDLLKAHEHHGEVPRRDEARLHKWNLDSKEHHLRLTLNIPQLWTPPREAWNHHTLRYVMAEPYHKGG